MISPEQNAKPDSRPDGQEPQSRLVETRRLRGRNRAGGKRQERMIILGVVNGNNIVGRNL